jgi:hypothetical protein
MRRIVLNLTPLLDLLLIIVFAYQVNTWLQATEARQDARDKVVQVESVVRELRGELEKRETDLSALAARLAEQRNCTEAAIAELTAMTEEVELARAKLAAAVNLLSKVDKEMASDMTGETQGELDELLKSLNARDRTAVEALQRYDMLSEELSIWELRFESDYRLVIRQSGSDPVEVFLAEELVGVRIALLGAMEKLPQPRKTVALFYSYGDLRVRRAEAMEAELRQLLTQELPAKFPDSQFILLEEGYVGR